MMKCDLSKPAIVIYINKDIKENIDFNELFWGIEEEGIPHVLDIKDEELAEKLAFKAAQDSRLGIGIGIGKNNKLVITHTKLNFEETLFNVHLDKDRYVLRNLGSNAARIVKGIPLKNI
ncbi:glycerol dehydratase reactivase beta/small subunit family protein [Clostridium rectalis]|uniref:glycerol dehydratase reactivase beta/small subunit family protein n=1 Tax=Clostridium rectalis TaxID=2040295 RepID=UPI000F62E9A7|nr:glycerol dehydratase reactivase beta/small subunit family protein [Clostridium rectalis]